jgi:hypothetical protein
MVFVEQMRKYYNKSLRDHERTIEEKMSRRSDCETIQRFYCTRNTSKVIFGK